MASANKKISTVDRPPLELYLVRLSPTCRAVWLYLLQVREYTVLTSMRDHTNGVRRKRVV